MRIAVYTLTRDRLHLARPCFERLWERAGAPFDHFVLDNGSVDGTPRWLEEHAARFARVVTSPTNLGIARGCNRLLDLIAEAGPYDLAIKLDDDCGLVTPDLLTRLAAALAADPLWRARRALSPRVLGLLHQPPRARYERLGPHRVGVTGHVGGIFLPVPWDLLRGYRFPDDLPLGAGADGHLCRWLVERGVTVGYLEDLEVRHHLTTVGQWNLERRYFSRKATERGRREVDPPRPDLDVRELAPTAGPRLPVTVVVPLSAGRRAFFEARGLPSLLAAGPERVVVVSGEAGACRKRNAGFARVRTPYVFFCDDDVELAPDALARLLRALEAQPAAGYAYCSYEGLVTPPATHPLGERFTHVARPFDAAALRRRNLASTMSLLRANLFPGFDEGLRRLQDWDLWLTLLDRGVEGVAVPEVLFTAHYLDQGITASVDGDEARAAVAARHDLDVGSAEVAWRQHVRALADLVSAPHLRRLATVGLAPLLREVVTAHAPREAQVVHELIDGPPVDVLVLGDGASVGGEALADRLAPRAAVVLEGGAAGGLHEWEARLRARGYELVADAFPTGPGLARIQLLGEQPPDPAQEALLACVRASASRGAAVLDLGAGLGEWAAQALADALGGRVLGAELDPGERLPLEDGSVDLIVAARTLDDLSEEDLARVGHELRRVLRPDGQVHLTIALGREGEVPGRRESLARAFPWLELGPGRVVPAGDRLLGVLSGRAGQAAARPAPRFTLVLVTHEERQATADLLDALDAFTRLPHERVLVDNASTDGTPELLRGRLRPGDLLVENRENHRCARATNQALALSSADLVVYLCARHALVTGPGWDEAVVGYMDEHPDVPLAGDVWSPYAQLLPGRRYRAGWTPEAHGRDRLLHVQGGAFVARRRIFEELGAFAADEYPHANMDVELSYRLLSHGRVLGMSPAISCPPAPAAPRAGALVVHPASDEVRRSVRARLRGPRAAERPPVALVFCERLDNESACESVVRALDEHLEVRPFGPGWPVERLEDVDPTGARFYLELDSASSNLARPVGLERLRVPKLAWLVDTHKKPEHHRRIAREMDLTFFAMQGWGHVLEGETAWLPLHADPRYFHPVEAERRWDLVFVGSQPWRAEPLRRIARRHGLSLHVTRTTGRREKSRTAELYAQARLVFNKHVTNDLNFRVFEATACGRVLLTDAQWNGQYELFEDGKHLVLYKDEADLERQVLRLLGDDALRAEIEQQAAAHAQARHTTAARVRELLARAEAVVGRLPVRAGETADVAGSSEDARAVQVTSPLESAVRACVPRPAGRRRWLVVDGGGAPTVDRQTYAGRLAQVLSSSGHDVLVAHVGSTRRAGVGPREVRLDPGSPPPGATPAQAFLASSAPLQRQLDRLAREHGPFDALLVEGALGQLAGPPLATRLCVPLLLALPTCEVQRRHGRLTRDQLYLAELEHWAADRAAHVLVPWPDVAAAVTARYEVSSPALVAWPASEVRAGGRGDLSARLGLDPPYAVLLGFREARGEPSLSRVALTDEATFVEGGGAQRRLGRRARGRLLAALLAGARAIVARPWDPARADAEDLAPGRVALVEDGPADLSALRFGARTRELDGARAALEGLLADHGQIEAGREEDVHVLL